MTPKTTELAQKMTVTERAKLVSQGLLTVLNSYSAKGYIDTGAHDVFVSIVREMGEITGTLEAAFADMAKVEKERDFKGIADRSIDRVTVAQMGLNSLIEQGVKLRSAIEKVDVTKPNENGREQ